MTFKHTKFEDSPTMRSLEKVAVKHGLLTPETLNKTASVKKTADYTPSNNLMENVIKLCAGLREKGFDKHANELEGKFFNYKRAFNAYETSKEKGDDLIDDAHPDGSHDLEGVEGDATIETVIDQHLKDLGVVNKNPTGKLASTKDIIGAVKVVLADDRSNLTDQINHNTGRILEEYTKVLDFISKDVNLKMKFLPQLEDLLKNPTVQNLKDAKNWIIYSNNVIKQYVSEGTWNSVVKSNIFAKIVSFIQPTIDLVNKVSEIDAGVGARELNPEYKGVGAPAPAPAAPHVDPAADFNRQVSSALNSIEQLKAALETNPPAKASAQGIAQANKWLDSKKEKITTIKQKLDASDKSPENIAFYTKLLDSILNKSGDSLDDFRKVWV